MNSFGENQFIEEKKEDIVSVQNNLNLPEESVPYQNQAAYHLKSHLTDKRKIKGGRFSYKLEGKNIVVIPVMANHYLMPQIFIVVPEASNQWLQIARLLYMPNSSSDNLQIKKNMLLSKDHWRISYGAGAINMGSGGAVRFFEETLKIKLTPKQEEWTSQNAFIDWVKAVFTTKNEKKVYKTLKEGSNKTSKEYTAFCKSESQRIENHEKIVKLLKKLEKERKKHLKEIQGLGLSPLYKGFKHYLSEKQKENKKSLQLFTNQKNKQCDEGKEKLNKDTKNRNALIIMQVENSLKKMQKSDDTDTMYTHAKKAQDDLTAFTSSRDEWENEIKGKENKLEQVKNNAIAQREAQISDEEKKDKETLEKIQVLIKYAKKDKDAYSYCLRKIIALNPAKFDSESFSFKEDPNFSKKFEEAEQSFKAYKEIEGAYKEKYDELKEEIGDETMKKIYNQKDNTTAGFEFFALFKKDKSNKSKNKIFNENETKTMSNDNEKSHKKTASGFFNLTFGGGDGTG